MSCVQFEKITNAPVFPLKNKIMFHRPESNPFRIWKLIISAKMDDQFV